jgi:hypothetical protein
MKELLICVLGIVVFSFGSEPSYACSITASGSKCERAPVSKTNQNVSKYKVGDQLPRGQYMVVVGTKWYGLPPASDGAVYFNVDGRALRVNFRTMEVLEDMSRFLKRRLRRNPSRVEHVE